MPLVALLRRGPLLGLVLLAACSSGAEGTAKGGAQAIPVTAGTVLKRDVPVELRAIGSVIPQATVAVKSQVEGQLAEIRFQEGQMVQRGDLLFVIDRAPFEAAVREAEARLAQDRAEAANARTESSRFERLVREGIVAREEYDTATTRAATSAAMVKADEAALETAKIQLQYCDIHAPISGRIGKMLVHAGNVVQERQDTLAIINQVQPVQVEFSVPQAELPAIRRASATGALPVTVSVPGDTEGSQVAGELLFVDNTVDTTTGTVLLKATFANQGEQLWPGQFVNVNLRIATQQGALLVPASAVQAGQGGRYVYAINGEMKAEPRPVDVGISVGDDIVILNGLSEGESIVVDGALRLAPGLLVEPKVMQAESATGGDAKTAGKSQTGAADAS